MGEAYIYPMREGLLYIPTRQYGGSGPAWQGSAFYTADNPPFGTPITYHLKDSLKTLKQQRREAEKAAEKKGNPLPAPSQADLVAEAEEEPPAILLEIRDATGRLVRTFTGPATQGMHRVNWDLRGAAATAAAPKSDGDDDGGFQPRGALVPPSMYSVTLHKRHRGKTTSLGQTSYVNVKLDPGATVDAEGAKDHFSFQSQVTKLQRAVAGTQEVAGELSGRLDRIKRLLDQTPGIDAKWKDAVRTMEKKNRDILRALRGDNTLRDRNENLPPSIADRVGYILGAQRNALQAPTQTQRDAYQIAGQELSIELAKLRTLIEQDLRPLERRLDVEGAPWTPGRLPEWKEK